MNDKFAHVHLALFLFLTTRVLLLMILSTGWSLSGFWLNLSYSIHSLQRLFTYNLRHFFSCTVELLQRWWECTRPTSNLEEQESNLRMYANKESGIWARRLEQALFSTYISPWVRSRSTKNDGRWLRCWICGDDYNPLSFGRIGMIGGYYLKVDFIL